MLVGTTSIEKSELLSQMLQRKGIQHEVLNAKNHEREAEIVAQAGTQGAVTIATNMAGRGTDILLGGNSEFVTKQDLVKRGQARSISAAEGAISAMAGPGMMRFYYQEQEFETSQENWERAFQVHQANTQREHKEVLTDRRPLHPGHRAPRVPPHRQPAPRPRRTPGRSRRIALLPVARRRPDAHLCARVGRAAAAEAGHG